MGSIVDLCWTNSEELFSGLELDDLYMRQAKVIAGNRRSRYPYVLLVHTGKITLGISLGSAEEALDERARLLLDRYESQSDEDILWNLLGETSD